MIKNVSVTARIVRVSSLAGDFFVKLSLLRPIGLSVAVCLVFSSTGYAQSPKAKLVPGSADVIHDISGIAIGMSCQDAAAAAMPLSNIPGKLNYQLSGQSVRMDNALVNYKYTLYEVPPRIIQFRKMDDIQFKCIEDGGNREVFELSRVINYLPGVVAAPPIESLYGLFQEKYGVPTVQFSPNVFATLFNRRGVIRTKDTSCVTFENGHLYTAYGPFNADKCSYALTFNALEARQPPGTIAEIDILIQDRLRLENILRAMAKQRIESTPVAAPRL
jgi:hypothetical protein